MEEQLLQDGFEVVVVKGNKKMSDIDSESVFYELKKKEEVSDAKRLFLWDEKKHALLKDADARADLGLKGKKSSVLPRAGKVILVESTSRNRGISDSSRILVARKRGRDEKEEGDEGDEEDEEEDENDVWQMTGDYAKFQLLSSPPLVAKAKKSLAFQDNSAGMDLLEKHDVCYSDSFGFGGRRCWI